MFLVLFNLLLIALYIAIGFIFIIIIACIWELIEVLANKMKGGN